MNDIEFILKEDIKKKKQAGSGYRYKKNGSKSKKCSLPSDNLSKKELNKMNGECKVYNLSEKMNYSNFCAMPFDLQVKYLEMLRDKFGANQTDIAKMMNVAPSTLASHRYKFLNNKPVFPSSNRPRLDKDAWNRFINGEKAEDTVAAEPDEKLVDACSVDDSADTTFLPYNKVASKADIVNGSMNLKGKAEDIFRKMMDILGCENEYEIYVCFKAVSK